MMTIKIQCGCGQRYAFDVDADQGRMTTAVACPVCGLDGTPAAEESIARSLASMPVAVAPASAAHARSAVLSPPVQPEARSAAAAPRPSALLPGQVGRPQAEIEARAKILWGDSRDEVIKYLMIQGFNAQEATTVVVGLLAERAATVRKNGIRKIIVGIGLMCVPVASFFGMAAIGFVSFKLLAVTIMVGVYGAYQVLKGTIMMLAPKSEPGDVSSH